jgi:tRNA G18 (ribose-2'-O)-methylase SpoU
MVFRTAAAFGVDAVLLGPKSCDPLCRRALRVSMGGVLRVPFFRSTDLAADLKLLKQRWSVALAGTVLADEAELLPQVDWPDRVGLMLGNEFDGLEDQWLAFCDHRATIPMSPGTDSLNLGVAAGIFVYERMRGRLRGS